jgi:hypothetical protein
MQNPGEGVRPRTPQIAMDLLDGWFRDALIRKAGATFLLGPKERCKSRPGFAACEDARPPRILHSVFRLLTSGYLSRLQQFPVHLMSRGNR